MKTLLIIVALFTLAGTSWGQKAETVVIHTSAECGQCKERLEKGLNYTKGVIFCELDLETQDITIEYNPKKTDPEKLKAAISEIGYDADDRKAKPEAVNTLPACCRPHGMEKHGGHHTE